jgi:uracil-DNA glycosylase
MAEAALRNSSDPLAALVAEIRACRVCERELAHGARPVLRAGPSARLCIVGQAPGIRVHESGIPFNDPSGDRLREWMGVSRDIFYDESRVAIIPMGFCFPGYDRHGGDRPPRKECARLWRDALFERLPAFPLTLVIGTYAMRWHLGKSARKNVSDTVRAWRDYAPSVFPLPHPSWRNNAWLKKNPWFETELLPQLRARVQHSLR